MKSFYKYLIVSVLITILAITMLGFYSLNKYHDTEVINENVRLEMCIRTFWQLLSFHGDDYRIVDGKLQVGSYVTNGNFELPDRIQEIFGGVATIFMGDERVSTNVLNAEGKRALGTRLEEPAYETVFKHGKSYRGKAPILGVSYLTAYDPITDKAGKVVGVLFVGVKESDFVDRLHVMKTQLTMTLLTTISALTFFLFLMGFFMKQVDDEKNSQVRFLQTLIDTMPNPVFHKDHECRYTGCNKAFEDFIGFTKTELIGKTPHELWPKGLADRYRQQDQDILDNPGTQSYETKAMHVDGTMHDVIFNKATFEGKGGSVAGLVGVILDITERKKAEEAVAFQNILLSTQLEASIDGILVVDENAKILSYNRHFAEIMNIPPHLFESEADEPVLEFVTGQMTDPEGFLEKVRYLYEHQQEICRDEICMSDGKTLDRYTVPLLGSEGRYYGRLWSFRDISERKAAEEQTKNSYQQLLDILEFLPDATFVIDKDKRVIAWNRAIEIMTGMEKCDVLGLGDYIYALPFYGVRCPVLVDLLGESPDVISRKYKCIKMEGRTLFTEAFVPSFRNGDSRYFWATASPLLDKQGNVVGAIESIRDVTEYKFAEEEKSRLESQLDHARLMETVMNRLGHDLKTPLTPLFILLPLIKNRLTDADLIKKVDLCIRSAASIKSLAEKARILSSISSKVEFYELDGASLASVVDRAVAESAEMITKKQIDCQNAVDPDILVHCVPAQLHELFLNLIANSVQFSSLEGVVEISAERHGETVMISVRDEGIGIDREHLNQIFEEFFKVDESRHELDASGLGLSICKRIVQNHHGRIWAESDGIGTGTTIRISLNEQRIDCIE